MYIVFLIVIIASFLAAPASASDAPPVPVASVDLERYVGRWYEIAKIPNKFQKSCAGNTTAEYVLREDGRIDVINRCLEANGNVNEARGIARIEDEESNARLKVSFVRFLGRNWFWGDYWVLGLGPEYEYAIVGHPERTYGWILSRTPKLGETTLARIFEQLEAQGYDPHRFELTPQE